jgi:hypothetical protein
MPTERAVLALRAALSAHERAAVIHAQAADLHARFGHPEKALAERLLEQKERQRFQQATAQYRDVLTASDGSATTADERASGGPAT